MSLPALPSAPTPAPHLPLLSDAGPERVVAWHEGRLILAAEFLDDVARIAQADTANGPVVNLCEDRYDFLAALGAALVRGRTTLLPGSRAPAVVDELMAAYTDCSSIHDFECDLRRAQSARAPIANAVGAALCAVIGYTSGSTGMPKPHPKRWDSFATSTALNAEAIRARLSARGHAGTPWIVATVPPQHMYGMELSVLLPLLGGMAVHSGRPLFAADIAAALAEVPEPRVLVSTPVHLRALCAARLALPRVALVVSATAPLDTELAANVERALDTEVLEMFGSTETCVIAVRRTAHETDWRMHRGIELIREPDGTRVDAPWIVPGTTLQDVVELKPERRFALRGRNLDMVEIAGKRASLAELTRRLLAVEGVQDAVVFQPEGNGAVRRLAALVVAPATSAAEIRTALRACIDPAFLPRPLVKVERLPRNELGKLPREALEALLLM